MVGTRRSHGRALSLVCLTVLAALVTPVAFADASVAAGVDTDQSTARIAGPAESGEARIRVSPGVDGPPGAARPPDDDSDRPTVEGAIEYDAETGPTPSTSGGDIELTFSEPVFAPGNSTLVAGSDLSVYVDGADVTDRFTVGDPAYEDGSRGRIILRSDVDLQPPQEVVVRVGTIRDAEGNVATPGNVSVQVSSLTVIPSADDDDDDVELQGLVPGERVVLDLKEYNDTFEIRADGDLLASPATGRNSHLFQWDAPDTDTHRTYRIVDAIEPEEDRTFNPYDVAFTDPYEVGALDAPSRAATGESVGVAVPIQNDGDAWGTAPVVLRFDGETVVNRSVGVRAGATRNVTLTFDTAGTTPGTHDLTGAVSGEDVAASVDVTEATRTTTSDASTSTAATSATTPTASSTGSTETSPTDRTASVTATTAPATTQPRTGAEVTGTGRPTTSNRGVPGFTPTLALVALLGVAFLARRRDQP